ncbi:MAG: polyphenol oxidase family protein [Candidatus Hydrogenedens sp.]|nr:polyphenol oxidase family protein [Candidatus Hydrogenedentota bacterium]NLF58061.1 polyphenol oxidase family protein [Candidatus Hydrogenedens sp.]
MIRLPFLENAGLELAAISGKSDGDCGRHAADPDHRAAFLQQCGVSGEPLALVRQVHGTTVVVAGNDGPDAADGNVMDLGEADGLITRNPEVVLGIAVADCVPVWLYDPRTHAGGLLHAGREGTVSGICREGVRMLRKTFGTHPEQLLAVIGPSAGPCCYEISTEMAEKLRGDDFPVVGRHLDLWAANREILEKAGLNRHNIHVLAHCTICGGFFHSFRKDGGKERNLAVLRLGARAGIHGNPLM